ncbi:molybdenum cofactor biosynthetic protein (CnxF) [Purpureocillium lilacinum]|uniref:Adenylyltransferase and sulfurtransferase uba4 n=1 Tax=Purpureocillium lilacinum TaxID=33203 RepID=A0A179HYC3_PURLI|nr:molybdenum cofactor biosynthetic protein (CnxF) [Purpureocillium lilacinum]OAQ95536.1 molybdenum cofactor biosynthetic protein (CnxF) [Purpureocillium lilacinum]
MAEPPPPCEAAETDMCGNMHKIDHLRREIARRETELAELKSRLAVAESEERAQKQQHERDDDGGGETAWRWPLEEHDYERYGRQMIVPGFGLQAQLRLKKSRILIVGAGGLGCPAAAYLAGAGVGTLGLVDADVVEVSNLHRQVAHATSRVGMSKVLSAITYLRELNPTITYRSHEEALTPRNARSIVSQYDLVLDCTDHPTSRYLVSDACVLLRRPLVSASAFQTSGQLVALNSPPGRGPCYRCVFPRPPPPESVVGCGEGGIVGPVVGVMGVLQALEAIRIICAGGLEEEVEEEEHSAAAAAAVGGVKAAEAKQRPDKPAEHRLLIFSAMGGDGPSFRSVRMKGRRADCFACSDKPGLSLEFLETSADYVQFCGVAQPVSLLAPHERVSVDEYRQIRAAQQQQQHQHQDQHTQQRQHLLVDVRPAEQFSLGSIPGAVNVPISRFNRGEPMPELDDVAREGVPVYFVCRVGNDSQIAARKFKDQHGLEKDKEGETFIGDIAGGLKAWKDAFDSTMPFV